MLSKATEATGRDQSRWSIQDRSPGNATAPGQRQTHRGRERPCTGCGRKGNKNWFM